jgi:hypothetical protein
MKEMNDKCRFLNPCVSVFIRVPFPYRAALPLADVLDALERFAEAHPDTPGVDAVHVLLQT